jgi:hypothetical protein
MMALHELGQITARNEKCIIESIQHAHLDRRIHPTDSNQRQVRVAFNHIDYTLIAFENVDKLPSRLPPDEKVAII